MGFISIYDKLDKRTDIAPPVVTKSPEEVFAGKDILPDAKEVTLTEYEVTTKNAITAHRLKDYRRKSFHLALLPKVDILFDKVLEGSDYWSELLHNESPYS